MMKIEILRGLPASGKSKYAKKKCLDSGGNWKRVNKDDLRAIIDNGKWSRKNEQFILKTRDLFIDDALKEGYSVVVDDTNFEEKHIKAIKDIAGFFVDVEVSIKDFDVDVETCIKRDLQRPNSVGEKVIRGMYDRYLKPKVEQYVPDKSLPRAVIFDVDGTLAKMERSPYDWARVGEDKPKEAVINVLKRYEDAGYKIIIFTGRDGICQDATLKWLKNNRIVPTAFAIRKKGNTEKDSVIKKEMFDKVKGDFNIEAVFDDRNQVVEMWRSMGLQCFQVAEGDF